MAPSPSSLPSIQVPTLSEARSPEIPFPSQSPQAHTCSPGPESPCLPGFLPLGYPPLSGQTPQPEIRSHGSAPMRLFSSLVTRDSPFPTESVSRTAACALTGILCLLPSLPFCLLVEEGKVPAYPLTTPSVFLTLCSSHTVPSAGYATLFLGYGFLLTCGSGPQHPSSEPIGPLRQDQGMAATVRACPSQTAHLPVLCPVSRTAT